MNEQVNATCTVCGNGYHMCLSCKDKMNMSPWKVYTDSAEHYKIHQIIHGFSTKKYTEDEARRKLKNVDLSDLETFKPNIKSIIKDILKSKDVVGAPQTEECVFVEKPVYSRKRNYKINEETAELE